MIREQPAAIACTGNTETALTLHFQVVFQQTPGEMRTNSGLQSIPKDVAPVPASF
jgi:hypothetical protein